MRSRVLIGDPDRELLSVFQSYLSGKGFQVSGTDNEQQCLRQLRELVPDVLVLEVDPARCWGEEVISALRFHGDLPDVPIIALTVEGERMPKEFRDGPIRVCLAKPFSMSKLVESIHEVIGSPV